jgi:hypothetical protein
MQPANYPNTTLRSVAQRMSTVLYPTSNDTTSFNANDTIFFYFDPPVLPTALLVMILFSENWQYTWRIDSGDQGWAFTASSCTLRIPSSFFPVESPVWGSIFHFNLMEVGPGSGAGIWTNEYLVARSEPFIVNRAIGSGRTWKATPERLATEGTASKDRSSGLNILPIAPHHNSAPNCPWNCSLFLLVE